MDLLSHPKYIVSKLCYLSEQHAFIYFRDAYKNLTGNYPSKTTLAILVAHSALETGRWKAGFYCWNFGNVRCPGNNPNKLKDGEYFTMFKCSEIINKKEIFYEPPHPNSVFRGFKSAQDGISHHLNFLKSKFPKAWAKAINGTAEEYSHALRAAKYYTANEERYTKNLASITKEFLSKINQIDFLNITHPDLPSIKPPEIIIIPELPPEPAELFSPEPVTLVHVDISEPKPESESKPIQNPHGMTVVGVIIGIVLSIVATILSL